MREKFTLEQNDIKIEHSQKNRKTNSLEKI